MTVVPVDTVRLGDEKPVTDSSRLVQLREVRAVGSTLQEALDRAFAKAQVYAPKPVDPNSHSIHIFLQVQSIEAQIVVGQLAPMIRVHCVGTYYVQGVMEGMDPTFPEGNAR